MGALRAGTPTPPAGKGVKPGPNSAVKASESLIGAPSRLLALRGSIVAAGCFGLGDDGADEMPLGMAYM